ncbi:hypothetical protein QUA74_13340 [Microcoleus sp. LAD1_D3]|uniref:hypothetical protein n=1 Tax=Microcoleus sp. LAD1_D3 TaxID=2819365 RepID=UPI002FD23798
MSSENKLLETEYLETEYLEIEHIEWWENIPDYAEDTFTIKTRKESHNIDAKEYDNNIMKIINEYSIKGWVVVSVTDSFVRTNRRNVLERKHDVLHRSRCYLLSRNCEKLTNSPAL